MLDLVSVFALTAVPMTIYVPPIRNLNLFVQRIEGFLRQSILLTLSTYPRLRFALSRIYNNIRRSTRRRVLIGI
ncbi:hypothetical protein L6164_034100 [Bauhinia variegata]|uniref:Uncharacterized protein n=1 Tax=Bauhinia variegata TaxID=167791 RepID=A0ACB9KU03_BAUVA|nr:hypothetical protein L6164_034100 [Bauhinia variegata]